MALLVLICWPFCIFAQNLIVNGGFETNAAGWTANFAKGYQPNFGNPPGCFSLSTQTPTTNTPTVSQIISGLTPGVRYAVTGDYEEWTDWGGGSPTNLSFGVAIDEAFYFEDTLTNSIWHSFSFSFIATSSNVILSISGQMNGTGVAYAIDNIMMQPVPSATASVVGADFVLSWPTNALGFAVQSSTNFVAGTWLDATNMPIIVGSNYSINLSATQRGCFFRLKR
jgi:hypothetical protein